MTFKVSHALGQYRAIQSGAPPHGGMAAGIDRIVVLLMGAPSDPTPQQLRELSLRVAVAEKKP